MKKILVADDEELIMNLVCDFLRRDGYEPLSAADGEEALEVLSYALHVIREVAFLYAPLSQCRLHDGNERL